MMKNQLLTSKNVASIGEEIGFELGNQFVKKYQIANPTDVVYYVIGRDIIDEILAQPDCVGLRLYHAYNELGQKTLVYVGINQDGKAILEYTCVNNEGMLDYNKGIVADRARSRDREQTAVEEEGWGWLID